VLVVLNKSPSFDCYDSILKIAERLVKKGEEVAVLHIQDACIAVTLNEHCKRLQEKGIEAYVLRADCEARGLLDKVGSNIKIVDYNEWVRLLMNEHDKVVSWT